MRTPSVDIIASRAPHLVVHSGRIILAKCISRSLDMEKRERGEGTGERIILLERISAAVQRSSIIFMDLNFYAKHFRGNDPKWDGAD